MKLDELPLEVLLALQQAMTDPSEEGAERARLRAEEAGVYLQLAARRPAHPPIPAPEAPAEVAAVELRFSSPLEASETEES